MHVAVPLPPSLAWLAFALPGVVAAAYLLVAWLTTDRLLRQALTPVVALAAWLLAVHACGLATRSFTGGLRLGTAAMTGAGVAWLAALRLDRASFPPPGNGRGLRIVAVLAIVASAVPVAWMAFGWAFHDEDLLTGHMSIVAEMQNDVYPPRHLTFAAVPMRYHYGFDLLVACVTAITRVRIDVGIDVASVLLWLMTATLLWAIGERWLRRGWLPLVMVGLAGGLPRCVLGVQRARAIPGVCGMDGPGVVSPLASMFFQHAWALGLPLALAAVLVLVSRDRERRAPRLLVLFVLFAALAIGQVVMFLALLPSAAAAELWVVGLRERRPVRALGVATVAAVAVAVASALALAPWSFGAPGGERAAVRIHAGASSASATLRWLGQGFGVLLPLGLVGMAILPRPARPVLALLLGGSLVVLGALSYEHSDDIIKFAVVAQIAAALAGAAVIARILDAARGRLAGRRALAWSAAGALVASASAGGAAFVAMFFTAEADRHFKRGLDAMGEDDQRAASFLRARLAPGEVVYRRRDHASGYAQWAGLPEVWDDWGARTFGFPAAWFAAREALTSHLPGDAAPWLAEGVRWFVLDGHDGPLGPRVDAWIAAGAAHVAATFGVVRVVRLDASSR